MAGEASILCPTIDLVRFLRLRGRLPSRLSKVGVALHWNATICARGPSLEIAAYRGVMRRGVAKPLGLGSERLMFMI